MKKTTIQTDTELLQTIKMYCLSKDIKVCDFVEVICSRDKDFLAHKKKIKKLKI